MERWQREARIRLGRVLRLNGRHKEAVQQVALSLLARRRPDLEQSRQVLDGVLAPLESDDRDEPWRYHLAQGRTADARLEMLRRLLPPSTP